MEIKLLAIIQFTSNIWHNFNVDQLAQNANKIFDLKKVQLALNANKIFDLNNQIFEQSAIGLKW